MLLQQRSRRDGIRGDSMPGEHTVEEPIKRYNFWYTTIYQSHWQPGTGQSFTWISGTADREIMPPMCWKENCCDFLLTLLLLLHLHGRSSKKLAWNPAARQPLWLTLLARDLSPLQGAYEWCGVVRQHVRKNEYEIWVFQSFSRQLHPIALLYLLKIILFSA